MAKWFKINNEDVFFNGLTMNQIGILVTYRCLCQQKEKDTLSEKEIKACFEWKERQFLINYLTEKGEFLESFGVNEEKKRVNEEKKRVNEEKNGNFLKSKNNDLACARIYNTNNTLKEKIDKTDKTDKTDRENSGEPPNKKYAFEGKIIKLNQKDFDKWQQAYPDLNLYAELLQRDLWLAEQPPDGQKRWYMSTAAYFIKQNERRKAQNQEFSNDNDDEPEREDWYL